MTHDQSYPGSAGVMGQKWLIRDDPPNYTTIIYAEGGDFVTQVYVGDSRDSIAEEIVRLHNATLSGAPAQSSDGGVEGHALSSTLAPQASAVADVVVHPAGVESGPSDPVEAARSGPVAQGSRVPKVRTSHHRNKEESARLQGLVAKRYAAPHPMLEAMGEIANRAGNFMDKDAADWMPSIYKIACEAIGADPWPMLEANGWKRETLTVSLSSTEGK